MHMTARLDIARDAAAEEALLMRIGERRIHAVVHRAPAGAGERGSLVFFIGDPRWSNWGPHRLFVQAARDFASHSFASFRFDELGQPGAGGARIDSVSEGEAFIDLVLRTIPAVRETLSMPIERMIFLGFCAGADLAVNILTRIGAAGVILWSIRLSTYRSREETVAGYLSRPEFRNLNRGVVRPPGGEAAPGPGASSGGAIARSGNARTPICIVNGELFSTFRDDAEAMRQLCPPERFSVCYECVPNGDQFFSSLAAKESVIRITSMWLQEHSW